MSPYRPSNFVAIPERATSAHPGRSAAARVSAVALIASALIVLGGAAIGSAEESGGDAPAAPSDRPPHRDGDGVSDSDDRCPGAPGLVPDGCPPRDGDGDGVLDRRDRCPEQPGPSGNDGCIDGDGDDDGVVDRRDRCPEKPGHPATEGCPAPDRDRDGWVDPDDRCPTRAEVWNGRRDGDGCPDRGEALLTVRGDRLVFTPGRTFRRAGQLTGRGRAAVAVAAQALVGLGARRVAIAVTVRARRVKADDPAARARARAQAVAAALKRLQPGLRLTVSARAPGASERVELTFGR
ncbi:MAG: thrombospondin type 3 repeat-containing protein [Myxococcota bacterium]